MSIEAVFKRPLLMPGVVKILIFEKSSTENVNSLLGNKTWKEEEVDGTKADIAFCVENVTTQEPHLQGRVTVCY